jgi:hypothetical protein
MIRSNTSIPMDVANAAPPAQIAKVKIPVTRILFLPVISAKRPKGTANTAAARI